MTAPSYPQGPTRHAPRRPLRLLDLMALVAAVALTLVSPGIMKAIIPARSLANWDRRQYVAHLAALVMTWWTLALVPLMLAGPRQRRALRNYGHAAILASAVAVLFLILRQVPVLLLSTLGVGMQPVDRFEWRVFDFLELAPVASATAILAAWVFLAITRKDRRPSNWFEWLGFLAGWVWIALALLIPVLWIGPIPWLIRSGITW